MQDECCLFGKSTSVAILTRILRVRSNDRISE